MPAYLGNGKLVVEGRIVRIQLQVRVLELFAAGVSDRGCLKKKKKKDRGYE